MLTLRELLKEHQEATDTDDDTMLSIVCQFLETWGGPRLQEALIDEVVENLERLPGDCS